MPGPLVIFEDHRFADLYPMTLTRPVFDLVCGIQTLGQKLGIDLAKARAGGLSGSPLGLHARQYLAAADRPFVTSYAALFRDSELITLVNGRLISCESILARLDPARPGKYVCGSTVVAATVSRAFAERLDKLAGLPLDDGVFRDLPSTEVDACVINYPWDLVNSNGTEIAHDFARLGGGRIGLTPPPGVHLVNDGAMRIARDASLAPGVVIDASRGPVNIESGVVIMANASLQGPLHIGAGTVVKMGARLYGDTSIGPVCRVGGEVAESIIQGYSNKQHDGFLGHSYVGEWVNLGAGTNTSDLKNNYSTVRVPIGGKLVDSGGLFAGLYIGDHAKSGIGTTFNTGSVVGVSSNIYGADYPTKYIPSFVWGGGSEFAEHRLAAALETAKRVMERRGKTFGARERSVFASVYELTRRERASFLA
ncbi:MAG TPA: putative sugar nucleotidyl transferase [bacterium]|nr:putative sugar nucleotidyl transferase [bacterium]